MEDQSKLGWQQYEVIFFLLDKNIHIGFKTPSDYILQGVQ